MKRIVCIVMLLTGISRIGIAQLDKSNTNKTFDLPTDFANRIFYIDLGKNNTIRLELSQMGDLDEISNLDSIVRAFIEDIKLISDTLADDLSTKRFDYVLDKNSDKKIRIQQFPPHGSSFTMINNELAALKLEQDTINFLGKVFFTAKYTLRKRISSVRSYRVSFFINDYKMLNTVLEQDLNGKIALIKQNNPLLMKKDGRVALKSDPSISAPSPHGYLSAGDYLNFRISVDAQNYKNYFVPSFSLGAGLIITSHGYFKRDLVLSWDPNFFFARDNQNKLKTFRNDFLTLTWGQGIIKDHEPRKESPLLFIMSAGYLIHKSGDFYVDHTMRIGAGRLSLFEGKTKIEPMIYFNDFFKGVTPGLRWIQSF